MGKVTRFSYMEIDLVADILDYYAKHGQRLLEAQSLPGEPGATLVSEPVGVILAIEPWNFPFYQLVRVAAPKLVAGNVVMMKHAESVPMCALAFARLFEEAGAPGWGLHQPLLQYRAGCQAHRRLPGARCRPDR